MKSAELWQRKVLLTELMKCDNLEGKQEAVIAQHEEFRDPQMSFLENQVSEYIGAFRVKEIDHFFMPSRQKRRIFRKEYELSKFSVTH